MIAVFKAGDAVVAARNLGGSFGSQVRAGTPGKVLDVRADDLPYIVRVRFEGHSLPWHVRPVEIALGGEWH